ncbi:hypothetical protein OUZ56_032177 [Daphnia magna]|uniref:Uncharacterized protein n=1 Tax=Daphnia magna TaxID=35525 RepID=A0ABQ9ZXF8_9CRUS|nr:hypothetical protein OUZ56_032177 [Daphnia magna]
MVVVELALFYSNTANLVRLGEKCMKYTKTSSHKQADYNPSGLRETNLEFQEVHFNDMTTKIDNLLNSD